MTVPQAARILGISERAVRLRIETKTLRAERDGVRWMIPTSELQGGSQTDDAVARGSGAVVNSGSGAESSTIKDKEDAVAGGREAVAALVEMNREKDGKIEALLGRVYYLQNELERAQEQIRLLVPPSDEVAPETENAPMVRPNDRRWWRRVFR